MPPSNIDAQFHRAVDIVQSLPKGGPVQTSYEEKLGLYSLYKQSTEGDISAPRPGMLDMLGRAKWDSWNKQKGKGKDEAKADYVQALLKILRKYADRDHARQHIAELEAFGSSRPGRPTSPSSSTSSAYHSSEAPSPPGSPRLDTASQRSMYPPPDPLLPPPDISPDIIPPSALNASHRSLLNLVETSSASVPGPSSERIRYAPSGSVSSRLPDIPAMTGMPPPPSSRAQSVVGGGGGGGPRSVRNEPPSRKQSIHSLRHQATAAGSQAGPGSGIGYTPLAHHPASRGMYSPNPGPPVNLSFTPEIPNPSPYVGHGPQAYPAHLYPSPLPHRPASASTFAAYPPLPINLPATLQQIQLSLTALHERMSTLERTQAIILRRDERKKGWFWGASAEETELDAAEEEEDASARARWSSDPSAAMRTATRTAAMRRRSVRTRVVWWLIRSVRRALLDAGVWMVVVVLGALFIPDGVRRARGIWDRVRSRARELLLAFSPQSQP